VLWSECSELRSQYLVESESRSVNQTDDSEVVAANDGGLTVTVPIRIKRRGLRKTVTLPDGEGLQPRPWDDTPTPL
jgi:hypothetical protein